MMNIKKRKEGISHMTGWMVSIVSAIIMSAFVLAPMTVFAQNSFFPEGEKLTYRILFDGYENAGYAELHVIGRGRLENRDAVEIRTRLKTTNFVGAALLKTNETRVAYADPLTGISFFTKTIDDPDGFSRERATDFRSGPPLIDIVSLIYALRRQTGIGSVQFVEGGVGYTATFKDGKSEKVRTGSGDFDTVVSAIESPFFEKHGIWEVRINFSKDAKRIPIEVRLRTKMGKMRISLASIQESLVSSVNPTVVSPGSTTASSAQTVSQIVSEGVPFPYGESTTLRITKGNRQIGDMSLRVGTRGTGAPKQTVSLSAMFNVSPSDDAPLRSGDNFQSKVDALTLLPSESLASMSSLWDVVSGKFQYDQENGTLVREGGERASMANGTHDLLSFLFAVRAFNLVPNNSPSSPVNDTRVSVVLGTKNMVFTIRPNSIEDVVINGKTRKAQMLTIVTGDSVIDQMSPKIWLGVSKDRPILKISMGEYIAEAI